MIDNVVFSHAELSFARREELIFKGLQRYVDDMAGEYLSESQISALCTSLKTLRYRADDSSIGEEICCVVYDGERIRNRFIPSKSLRKDEMAILLYNISPYALLNRIQTAIFAKCSFPNFFATVGTINSTFTKYSYPYGNPESRSIPLQITNLDSHSSMELEKTLIKIAVENNL